MSAAAGAGRPGSISQATTSTASRTRAASRRRPMPGWLRGTLMWGSIAAIVLFCLFPVYWIVNTSLKTGAELSSGSFWPDSPSLRNYRSVMNDGDFLLALRNSAIVATSSTILSITVGAFAAYALARLRFPRKALLLGIVLSISTFPVIAIAAPLFKLWTDIGLYDAPYGLGLIIPNLVFTLPLTIFILTSFFREIPKELEEAALVDGATRIQAFTKIVLPLAAPGLATAALLAFFAAWNEFLFSITLTSTPEARTVPAAIAFFTGSVKFEAPLGTISAASVIVMIPLVVLVLVFQKRIVAGLTAGAVKG
ncbi:MAG: carbohydrate transporter rane protein 2, family [Thermoleophilia bacterium]|nr:carbohydrate transporter rane protein 2, family [Thermoleophilia bacterium]